MLNRYIVALLIVFIASLGLNAAIVSYNVPTVFSSQTADTWRSLESQMLNSSSDFIFYWKGDGGDMYLGEEFIRAMEKTQSQGKAVNLVMSGNSYSLHSLVLCHASKVKKTSAYFLMYHSVGYMAKGIHYRQDNSQYKYLFDYCIQRGLMPKNGYTLLQQGYVVYYYPATGKTIIEQDLRPRG